MVFSIKESGHSQKIEYVKALFNENCNLQAMNALQYRKTNHVSIEKNVSNVTLEFSTDRLISVSAQSSGANTVLGHSERVALVKALNKAIADKMELFTDHQPISNTQFPPIEELNQFKSVLQSLKKITIYTERMPCTRDGRDGSEQCDIFFAKLFENVNYEFYYSIPLGTKFGIEINNELDIQVKKANAVYEEYLKYKDRLQNIESELKNIDNKLQEELKNNPITREDGSDVPGFELNANQKSLIQTKERLVLEKRQLMDNCKKIEEQNHTQLSTGSSILLSTKLKSGDQSISEKARLGDFKTKEASKLFEKHEQAESTVSTASKDSLLLSLDADGPPKSKPKPTPKQH